MSSSSPPTPPRNADGVYVINATVLTDNPRQVRTNDRPDGEGLIIIYPFLEDENIRIERKIFAKENVDQVCITTFNGDDIVNLFTKGPPDSFASLLTLMAQINQARYEITLSWRDQTLVLTTQGGNDRIHIDDEINVPVYVFSGEGNDRVVSSAHNANLFTGPGDDFISVIDGLCHVEAGPGDDEVHGFQQLHMTVYGGPGNDDISGGSGSNFIDGGEGDDHIVGGSGHNILSGARGNDRIKAGPDSNVIYTGDGLNHVTRLKAGDITYFNFKSNLSVDCALALSSPTFDQLPQGELASHAIHLEPRPLERSGITVQGSAQFVERVNDDLRFLLSSPTGQRLLAELERATLASGQPLTIHEYREEPNGLFLPDPTSRSKAFIENDRPGRPSYGGKIWYNSTDVTPGTPSVINLFHELCHAYNYISGTVLRGESLDGIDGTKPRRLTDNAELQAVGLPTSAPPFDFDQDPATPPTTTNPQAFTENGLRKELGLPLRAQYALPPDWARP